LPHAAVLEQRRARVLVDARWETTPVSFFHAIAGGGSVVSMVSFDAGKFLELSQRYQVTHAMLVPVQYRASRPNCREARLAKY
jgi:hypothetical protein